MKSIEIPCLALPGQIAPAVRSVEFSSLNGSTLILTVSLCKSLLTVRCSKNCVISLIFILPASHGTDLAAVDSRLRSSQIDAEISLKVSCQIYPNWAVQVNAN